jgi:hypothetical protein
MRISRGISLTLLTLLILPVIGLAQGNPHELFIPPPTGPGQYLNTTIMGDTISNGTRADSLRVYVLQRGGIYLVNSAILNQGWTLRIKAKDTVGVKPAIYLTTGSGGTIPGAFVTVRGHVWLKNIAVAGYNEYDPTMLGKLQGVLLTTTAAGFDIVVDSCMLSNINGNHIRTGSACRVVKVTNTVFANMGYLGTSNLGAGKAIDLRDVSCDTLLMQNCTFVNFQDRIIRHRQSTASLKVVIFDHNTVVNGMSYHGMIALGWVGQKVAITNNLFVDAFALGADTDAVRQSEFEESREKDAFGTNRMTWVINDTTETAQWKVSNNYYCVTPTGQSWMTNAGANPPLTEGSPLTYRINRKLGADSTKAFTKEDIALAKVPALMTAMMTWYRTPSASGGAGKTKVTTNFAAQYDYDRRTIPYFRDTLNCTYATGKQAYTGAENGYPAGDLNWYPALKARWDKGLLADVATPNILPACYALEQNYPNPFNPATTIHFTVPREARVRLEVFDILGRRVAVLVDELRTAGEHAVAFDASRVGTGTYIYRLTAEGQTITRKMMLLK